MTESQKRYCEDCLKKGINPEDLTPLEGKRKYCDDHQKERRRINTERFRRLHTRANPPPRYVPYDRY